MLDFIVETSRLSPNWSVRNTVGSLIGHIYWVHTGYVFSAASVMEIFDSRKLDEIANFLERVNDQKIVDTAPPA